MELKLLFRVCTPKKWRRHKRKAFFERIFEYLKDDLNDNRADGMKYGTFEFIKSFDHSFEESCRKLACSYDYNPFFDKTYKFEKEFGKAFEKHCYQTYDSLSAIIRRESSVWEMFIHNKGLFEINVNGKENGESFEFSYKKYIKVY